MILEKKRRSDIDMLKAFCIICMIMGHVEFTDDFNKWIHGFHMPAFFIISGYLHKKTSLSELIKKRAKTLLIPYFVFGILNILIDFAIEGYDPSSIRRFLFYNTSGSGVPMAGGIWFLTCMFFTEVFYVAAQEISGRNSRLFLAILILMNGAGIIITCFVTAKLPWAMDTALFGTGLYHMGRLVKLSRDKVISMSLPVTSLMLIIFSVLIMYNDFVNMRKDEYGIFILFWINSFGMTTALWSLFNLISRHAKPFILTQIGKDSVLYLCLNQLFIHFIKDAVILLGINYYESPAVTMCCSISVTLLTVIGIYICAYIINHTPLKVVMGRGINRGEAGKKEIDGQTQTHKGS